MHQTVSGRIMWLVDRGVNLEIRLSLLKLDRVLVRPPFVKSESGGGNHHYGHMTGSTVQTVSCSFTTSASRKPNTLNQALIVCRHGWQVESRRWRRVPAA